MQNNRLLRRKRIEEGAGHIVMNTGALYLKRVLIGFALGAVDVSSQSELVTKYKLLREKSTLLAAVVLTARGCALRE